MNEPREEILFNFGWLFHRGDVNMDIPTVKGPVYTAAKTERMKWGPAARFYNDALDDFRTDVEFNNREKWECVDLPHDYIINGEMSEKNNNALGFFSYENAWYRKHFTLDESDKNKRITVIFEGVATNATVYLNGCLIKRNFSGYTTFECDISDYIVFGEDNVLSVYVKIDGHEGWWYEGGGIYRNVHLVKTEKICSALFGVYVSPEKQDEDKWNVNLQTEVINDTYNTVLATAKTKIIDENGEVFAACEGECEIGPCSKSIAEYSVTVNNPHLWDTSDAYQYDVVTDIYSNGKLYDTYKTKTGFRTIKFDAKKGFFLNGRHTVINGVCSHTDCGLLGKAVPDNIHRHKIRLVKEMGANAYRTSHYPHPKAVMDALDNSGILVMDETRRFESCDESVEQLEMLVKRDRNRPSVIMWSVGNEEPYQTNDNGRRINRRLIEAIRRLDKLRPICAAVSNEPDKATVFDDSDIIGINYNHWNIDMVHEKYPEKPMFSSECCATSTTRNWYFPDDATRGYMYTYDRDTNSWFTGREFFRQFLLKRPWMFGSFQWIAFEHRGETVWPRICSQSGAIDLFLQKKDAFYQNQSHWLDKKTNPMIHILPHWNWNGFEGRKITVFAYTNCDEAELFLNGKSLGKQKTENATHGEWQVEYTPGELKAVGYINGKQIVCDEKSTSKKAAKLKLRLENGDDLHANGTDIALFTCFCEDEDGKFVPNAEPFVSFNCDGGKIIGTGSDVCDHTPVNVSKRQMYMGLASVAIKVPNGCNKITLFAKADNLDSVVTDVDID